MSEKIQKHQSEPKRGILRMLGPGILLAATGVGAGDLAGGSFAGVHLGVAILWAVLAGALLKFVLNEGLARYQLATGRTLLEGACRHFPYGIYIFFIPYFIFWSYFVGSALIGACGVTAHAILPVFEDAKTGKICFGIAHSIAGLVLIWFGGFKVFERFMSVCIAVMFVTVVVTACMVADDWAAILRGLVVPAVPEIGDPKKARDWTISLMGGVGGTLTVLCYGYWLREENRTPGTAGAGADHLPQDGEHDVPSSYAASLRMCRIDLAAAYGMTAIFGVAMVIIGSTIKVEGSGATLVVALAEKLETQVGQTAKWFFLIGAWGAVFSSLLGVLQAVPYLFADVFGQLKKRWNPDVYNQNDASIAVDTNQWPYRAYLILLALVPIIGLFYSFENVQKFYGIIGAWFMPILALTLLLLMTHMISAVPIRARNGFLALCALIATLVFFFFTGWQDFSSKGSAIIDSMRQLFIGG